MTILAHKLNGFNIMKIVIPVSNHDEDLIDDFCNVVEFLGPYLNHELLIVCRPSDIEFGLKIFNRLKKSFKNPIFYKFKEDGTYGWPQGPNHYWKQTIEYLIKTDNQLPWFWLEIDCTPVKNDWLDLLEDEYNSCGTKCLGMVQLLTSINKITREETDTYHLVGVAIYPPDFHKICSSWKELNDDSFAFDVHCQNEIMVSSTNSKLMQQSFRTHSYDCTDVGLKGVYDDPRQFKYKFDRPIEKDVVVVHGCNDGSLAQIICNIS